MSCKDCQCSKNVDQTLVDDTKNLDLSDKTQECKCSSCNARSAPQSSGCSCCRPRPPRRNCRCCPCRSCCGCCTCCADRPGICAAGKKEVQASDDCSCCAKKEEVPQKAPETVTASCKCCAPKPEAVPKKVCAGCGCDKCA